MNKFQYIWGIIFLIVSINIQGQNIDLQGDNNLAGLITDGNKGIEGIVVSDGYTVTTTNKNGEYQLARNKKAKFVFISTPNNYQLPVEGSLPAHYKRINQELETVYANFQLTKEKVENKFTLVAIADPQPSKDWELKRFRDETIVDINALIKENAKNSFLGIAVGDLTWDAPELYPSFVDAINQLPFTLLPVIGNHDHDQQALDDDYAASQNYEKYLGPTYYSYNKGQCHFVVLDDIIYYNRKKYDNEITKQQLEWLKEDLKYVSKDKLIVLGVHVPTDFRGQKLNNTDALYDILAGRKVVAISGHTHDGETSFHSDAMTEYILNAAFGSGWVGDIGRTGAPNGYAVFNIEGNKVVNQYYKATGKDKGYQMKLYPPNSWKTKKDGVIANIWNYNTKWQLEVLENGVKSEGLTQYEDFDPFAYEYMFGPNKPKHRPRTEPKKTNKLFFYKPKNDKAVIEIVAKDEFGNTYSSKIDFLRK